jgi:hypothetical protein
MVIDDSPRGRRHATTPPDRAFVSAPHRVRPLQRRRGPPTMLASSAAAAAAARSLARKNNCIYNQTAFSVASHCSCCDLRESDDRWSRGDCVRGCMRRHQGRNSVDARRSLASLADRQRDGGRIDSQQNLLCVRKGGPRGTINQLAPAAAAAGGTLTRA